MKIHKGRIGKALVALSLAGMVGCGGKSPINILYPKDDFGKTLEFALADSRDACALISLSINAKERKIADESLALALMNLQGGGVVTVVDLLATLNVVDSKLRMQLALLGRRLDERVAIEFTNDEAVAITSNVIRGCREGLANGAPEGATTK